jgi:Domain of unknown function (DUF4384)
MKQNYSFFVKSVFYYPALGLLFFAVWSLSANAANAQKANSEDGQTRDIIPVFEKARAKNEKKTGKNEKRQTAKSPVVKRRVRILAFTGAGLKQSAVRFQTKKKPPVGKKSSGNQSVADAQTAGKPELTKLQKQVKFTSAEFEKAKKLGITLWKFDKRKTDDKTSSGQSSGSRSVTHPIDDSAVIRVNQDTIFRVGDKIRVSVESPTAGYLYVANCEVYQDGSFGTPSIIFPTKRTRGGVNFLAVGSPIELPSINDRPNYFLLTESLGSKKVVAEALIFVVTKSPLADFETPEDTVELGENQLASWEKKWTGRTEIWEVEGQEKREYTQAEYESGSEILREGEESKGRSLKADEPEPQTLYAVESPTDDGMLFTLLLRYE